MTMITVLLTVVSGSIVAAVWVLWLRALPEHLCSLYRYKLWRMRDDTVDDMIYGRLTDDPGTRRFVALLEGLIHTAPYFTFARSPFLPRVPRAMVYQQEEECSAWLARLPSSQRQIYVERIERLRMAVTGHLLFGSPSGWLAAGPLVIVGLLVLAVKRVRGMRISFETSQGLARRIALRPAAVLAITLLPSYLGPRIAAIQQGDIATPGSLLAASG